MTRTAKRHTPPASGPQHSEKMINQEFSRRLFDALIAKGWKQSRLARECFGTTTTKQGHTVAKGRDRISSYVRGTALPDPVNLHKIASALGMSVAELAPDIHFHTATREEPEMYMSKIPGLNKVQVKIERSLPTDLAIHIFGLIAERDLVDASENNKPYARRELISENRFAHGND